MATSVWSFSPAWEAIELTRDVEGTTIARSVPFPPSSVLAYIEPTSKLSGGDCHSATGASECPARPPPGTDDPDIRTTTALTVYNNLPIK